MSQQTPILEQLKTSVNENVGKVSDTVQNIKGNVQSNLDDFSNKGVVGVGSDFLESNGLLAKFAFIIFVLIIFLFLFKLGVQLLGYLTGPIKSPFLVYGKINGNNAVTISQDPQNTSAVTIYRSSNQPNGAEFTWSVWLYINENSTTDNKYKNIFYKGPNNTIFSSSSSGNFSTNGGYIGIAQVNGPGMYFNCDNTGVGHMLFYLDDIENTNQKPIKVDNIPLQKWIHVVYRLQNTILDVYINGNINNRMKLNYAPSQNFYDVQVCANNGFTGYLSNLRYYDYALNVFDINNIVMFGPNTANSVLSSDYKNANGDYSYLSTKWYNIA